MIEAIKKILKETTPCTSAAPLEILPFRSREDGAAYEVWKVTHGANTYVWKKAKQYELEIYSAFFADGIAGVPRFYGSACSHGTSYFLMEYVTGEDLCRCDRQSLKKALDALIGLQARYWENKETAEVGFSFAKSLAHRNERGAYLGDAGIEAAYGEFLSIYQTVPRTLCHDDLLPFNVLVSENRATIIDWELAGILPYPTALARLLAHGEETENAFFYMKEEDKSFAIDYYYRHLIEEKGIPYGEYRRTMDLFLLYEYCEWIMLGVKYRDADMDRYRHYLAKAGRHIEKMGTATR
ncbi:MAG: aminoglycoside phosphotransferase family protein [Clostridia bacterium]|nr:aminoglycoside phosphotransferase family protein [Clostridia bacterium]